MFEYFFPTLVFWLLFVLIPILLVKKAVRNDYERKLDQANARHKEELEALRSALIRLRSDVGLSPKRPTQAIPEPTASTAPTQAQPETQELVLRKPLCDERPDETQNVAENTIEQAEPTPDAAPIAPREDLPRYLETAPLTLDAPVVVLTPDAKTDAKTNANAKTLVGVKPLVLEPSLPQDGEPTCYELASTPNDAPIERAQDAPSVESSAPQVDKTPEQDDGLEKLETLIGRKVFGWIGVGLFLLCAAFFVQIAIVRGWLTPSIRFAGLVVAGGAFLCVARRVYRKGGVRYSEILNGAGLVTLLVAGYYARAAALFPLSVSSVVMIATVFAGFALAAVYRSAALAYVAATAGLVVPALVDASASPWTTSIYLLAYYAAALRLVARLKRSELAIVPWAGALAFFLLAKVRTGAAATAPDLFFGEATFFLAFFLLFDALELVLLAFCRKRSGGYGDLVRACLTGLVCFGIFWRSCAVASHVPAATYSYLDWFHTNYGYVALAFFAFFGTIWAVSRRCDASFRFDENDDCWKNARAANGLARILDLPVMFGIESFVFLTIGVTATCSNSFLAPTWLALSTALFIAAARKSRGARIPDFVASIESDARRALVVSSLQKTFLSTLAFLSTWGWIYLTFGAFVLTFRELLPNMYPIETFLQDGAATNACPFFNATAFPTTLGFLLALGAAFALRYKADAALDLVPNVAARHAARWARQGAIVSVVFGVGALLLLSASELFSFVSARAVVAGIEAPGVVGYCALLTFWLFAASLFFAVGTKLDQGGTRALGLGVWFLVALKLTLRDLVACHPILLGLPIAPILCPFRHSDVSAYAPDAATPLINAFSIPFVLAALVGIAFAVVLRNSKRLTFVDNRSYRERSFGLFVGLVSLGLLWAISTFDVAGWFYLQPDRYDDPTFYAWHGVWLLWIVFALTTWQVGRFAKSAPVRVFAYSLLTLLFPCVVVGEFFTGDWRTNHAFCDAFFSVYALPAACCFVLLTAQKGMIGRLSDARRGEKTFGFIASVAGVVSLVALLSFETFRYFTGKTWFGPDDWTRLIALTALWTFGACVFAAFAKRSSGRARTVCVAVSVFFLALVFLKYFFLEITHASSFRCPFFNSFGFETLFVGLVALGLAFFYRVLTPKDGDDLPSRERAQTRRNLTLALAIVAVGQLWLGSSFDVYRCARVFPASGNVEPAFLAQTALSALWTFFAAALLAIGFWKRASWLRWLAIGLFGVTIVKALTLDMSYLDSVYRVVAFFVLATATTLASGAYWKRKR